MRQPLCQFLQKLNSMERDFTTSILRTYPQISKGGSARIYLHTCAHNGISDKR